MHFDTELMRLTRELAKPGMLVTPLVDGEPGLFFTPKRGTVYRLSSRYPNYVLKLDDSGERGYAIDDGMLDPGRAFSDWVIVPWADAPQMKHVDGDVVSARCKPTFKIYTTERAFWCPVVNSCWAMPKLVRRTIDAVKNGWFYGDVENDSKRSLENWSFVDPSSVKPLWDVSPSGRITDPKNQFFVIPKPATVIQIETSEEKNMPTIKKTAAAPAAPVLTFKSGDRVKYLNPAQLDVRDGTISGIVLCAGKKGCFDFGIQRDDNETGGYFGYLWGIAYSDAGVGTEAARYYVLESEYEVRKAERDERLKPKIAAFERGACVEAIVTDTSAPLAKQPGKSLCVHNGAVGFVRSDDGKSDTVTVYYAVEMPRKKLKATGNVKRPGGEVV